MSEFYLIKSDTEFDEETGESLYWSNVDGWVDLFTALESSTYTWGEVDMYKHIPHRSKWVKFVETEIE